MRFIAWEEEKAPEEEELRQLLAAEGLSPYAWSNGAGYRYGTHTHSYHKVIYTVRGSIRFTLPGTEVEMHPGDRLELPPDTPHGAIVGNEGVTCLEAHRD